jgi:hypothetical protein
MFDQRPIGSKQNSDLPRDPKDSSDAHWEALLPPLAHAWLAPGNNDAESLVRCLTGKPQLTEEINFNRRGIRGFLETQKTLACYYGAVSLGGTTAILGLTSVLSILTSEVTPLGEVALTAMLAAPAYAAKKLWDFGNRLALRQLPRDEV